jgi:hypothetical protein
MKYRNICRCKICGDIIESKSVHDYTTCSCGACSTDGGLDYISRSYDPKYGSIDDVIENLICNVGSSLVIDGKVY